MAPEKKIVLTLFDAQHRAEKLPLVLSGAKYYWILYRSLFRTKTHCSGVKWCLVVHHDYINYGNQDLEVCTH